MSETEEFRKRISKALLLGWEFFLMSHFLEIELVKHQWHNDRISNTLKAWPFLKTIGGC